MNNKRTFRMGMNAFPHQGTVGTFSMAGIPQHGYSRKSPYRLPRSAWIDMVFEYPKDNFSERAGAAGILGGMHGQTIAQLENVTPTGETDNHGLLN